MHTQIRKLTEGAITVAIIGMILIINRLGLGLFEQYFSWLLPLPLLVYTAKYGLKDAIIVYFSSLILAIMLALLNTVVFVALTSFTGMIYGHGVYQKKENHWLLKRTIFLSGITYFLSMLVFARFFGYDVLAEVNAVKEMMVQLGFNAVFAIENITWIIACMIVLIAIMESLIIHLLAHFLLPKIKISIQPLKNLIDIRLALPFKLILLILMILGWIVELKQITFEYDQISLTLGYIAELIFCICGLIVIMVYSRVTKKQYIMMIVIALILFKPKLLMNFLLVLGISDIIIDYRKHMIGWLKK